MIYLVNLVIGSETPNKSRHINLKLAREFQIDAYYKENLDLIEERIITIKARNFDEAISKGEKEAKDKLN